MGWNINPHVAGNSKSAHPHTEPAKQKIPAQAVPSGTNRDDFTDLALAWWSKCHSQAVKLP
jgi:hypothetical protein